MRPRPCCSSDLLRKGSPRPAPQPAPATPSTPRTDERSERLASSRDPDYILRNFRTLLVDASRAQFFGNDQMKTTLQTAKGFDVLHITVVDDRSVADVILEVGYTFAWDYPFSLKHQNTSVVLLSGKGSGPFSGPAGATSVARELVKLLQPYRVAQPDRTRR